MATQSRDTSADAERVQFQIWREMPGWRKLELVAQMNETVRELATQGLRQRSPKATGDELKRRYMALILGEELSTRIYGELPKDGVVIPEPIAITLRVIESFDKLKIAYLIGGSLASAVQGEPRSTVDADIVADMEMEDAAPFVRALADEFYVDEESIREAIQNHRSFNAIHLATGFKVDVFIRRPRAFDNAQFARRTRQIITTNPVREAFVATPEDTILAKLEWYKFGGETSDRQWRDILGIFKAQGERLDRNYLQEQSQSLGVQDLLERVMRQIE